MFCEEETRYIFIYMIHVNKIRKNEINYNIYMINFLC